MNPIKKNNLVQNNLENTWLQYGDTVLDGLFIIAILFFLNSEQPSFPIDMHGILNDPTGLTTLVLTTLCNMADLSTFTLTQARQYKYLGVLCCIGTKH